MLNTHLKHGILLLPDLKHVRNALLCLLVILLANIETKAQGSWRKVTRRAPHYNNGVMLLMTDGTILCKNSSGGMNGKGWDKLTPDATGSYINGTWTSIASMTDDRLYFSTQVLRDGRVYVAGGEYGSGGPKAAVYNPVTNTWTACPQIVVDNNISDANSEILPDGKVLQAVVDTDNAQLNWIWDPATNTYAPTGTCLQLDNEAAWVKLPDQSILFIDNYGTTSERFIPATQTWINDGTVPDELYDPYDEEMGGGYMLPNGQAFFIGSAPTTAYYTPSGSTSPGVWTAGPAIPNNFGAPDAASANTVDGKILMALSLTPRAAMDFPDSTTFYIFDYTTNTFTMVGAPGSTSDTLQESTYITNMLDLPDGTILFANQGDDNYYEFVTTGTALAAGVPTVAAAFMESCDTFMATGLLFNGISEGASYGDDWQIETNYPLIRLLSGTNVYYTKTYNWNRTAIMTGSLPDTTMFVLPAGLPVGAYSLQVVVNGIPSATIPFNTTFTVSPASVTMCASSTSTLTASWGGGTWTSGNTGVATVDPSTGVVSGVTAGTVTISYTIGSCVTTSSFTINTSLAAISATGATSVCPGATTTLSDPTTGGTWSSSAAGVATVSTSGVVTGVTTGTANISYSIGSCFAIQSVTVTAGPASPAIGTLPTAPCSDATATYSVNPVTGATAYNWSVSGTGWSGSSTTNTIDLTAGTTSGVISVTETSSGCTSAATSFTVTPTPLPGSPVITAPSIACGSSTGTYTATSTSATSYSWTVAGSGWSGSSSTGTIDVTMGTGTGTITSTATNACGSASAAITATVPVAAPSAPTAGASSSAPCSGGSATYSVTPSLGAISYNWTITGTGWSGSSTTNAINLTAGTGVATVSVTATNGCGTSSAYVFTVTAASSTLATPAIAVPSLPCGGTGATTCTATATGATSYSWSVLGTGWSGSSSTGSITVAIGSGTGTVICTALNPCATSAPDTVTITPASSAPATSTSIFTPTPVCSGNFEVFTTSVIPTASSYNWSVSGTGWSGSSATNSITMAVGTGPATISVWGINGCGGASPFSITVVPILTPLSRFAIQNHVTVPSTPDTIVFTGIGYPATLYTWSFGASGFGSPGTGSAMESVHWTTTGLKTITLNVADSGCTTTYSDTVLVVSSLDVPELSSKNASFNVIPNPNAGSFEINFTTHTDKAIQVRMVDMAGREVYNNTFDGLSNKVAIETQGLASGTYIVTVTIDGDVSARTITIQK